MIVRRGCCARCRGQRGDNERVCGDYLGWLGDVKVVEPILIIILICNCFYVLGGLCLRHGRGVFAGARCGGGGAFCRRIARGAGLRRGGHGGGRVAAGVHRRHIGGIGGIYRGICRGVLWRGRPGRAGGKFALGHIFCARGLFYVAVMMGECFKFSGCGGARNICVGRAASGVFSRLFVWGFAGVFCVCFGC